VQVTTKPPGRLKVIVLAVLFCSALTCQRFGPFWNPRVLSVATKRKAATGWLDLNHSLIQIIKSTPN
jgi:hypothetical protein